MDAEFLKSLLKDHDADKTAVYIASDKARILACNNPTRVGDIGQTAKHVLSIGRPISLPSTSSEPDLVRYGLPIASEQKIEYVVVVRGKYEDTVTVGEHLAERVKAAFAYHQFVQQKNKEPQKISDEIAATIIKSDFNIEAATSLMLEHEYNPNLLRSAIVINLNFHQNRYFNINLSLGYETSIEQSRQALLEKLRQNRYLNAQDIVYTPNRNTYIILKSFASSTEMTKIYQALTVICNDLHALLKNDNAYQFGIAYGEVYNGIENLYLSLREANNIIDLGERTQTNCVHHIRDLMLEYTSMNMKASVENQMIKPYIDILLEDDSEFLLLFTTAVYIDHCMNIAKTAEQLQIHRNTANARVLKFQRLTGLEPSLFFKDAFIVKMMELYVRRTYAND